MKSIFSVLFFTLLGCSSTPPVKSVMEVRLDPSTLVEKAPAQKGPDLTKASDFVRNLVNGAEDYITSEQVYGRDQIWHKAVPSTPKGEGLPVSANEYVFPGGKNVSFECNGSVASDELAEAIALKLGTECEDVPGFIFIYTTGPKSGFLEATARIESLYSSDRSVVERVDLYLDKNTQEVVIEFFP